MRLIQMYLFIIAITVAVLFYLCTDTLSVQPGGILQAGYRNDITQLSPDL